MEIERVQDRDTACLPVDGVDLRGLPQMGDFETHLERRLNILKKGGLGK